MNRLQSYGVSSVSVSGNLLVINILVCNTFCLFLMFNVTANNYESYRTESVSSLLYFSSQTPRGDSRSQIPTEMMWQVKDWKLR